MPTTCQVGLPGPFPLSSLCSLLLSYILNTGSFFPEGISVPGWPRKPALDRPPPPWCLCLPVPAGKEGIHGSSVLSWSAGGHRTWHTEGPPISLSYHHCQGLCPIAAPPADPPCLRRTQTPDPSSRPGPLPVLPEVGTLRSPTAHLVCSAQDM